MADAIDAHLEDLLEANQQDLEEASSRTGADALPASTISRLTLTEAKIAEMAMQIRSVVALPDPLGRVLDAIELDDQNPAMTPGAPGPSHSGTRDQSATNPGLHLEKISVPLGVLCVIFEARPDAVTQIASLAIKSGNAVLLKPGKEVAGTAQALVDIMREVLVDQGLPKASLFAVFDRSSVDILLQRHDLIDLAIPRGSKQLVDYVMANSRIPVLGHSEGICHIYVDRAANEELAMRVIEDAKRDYPAACNAVETVLVHREIATEFLPKLAEHLRARGITLHGDAITQQILRGMEILPVHDWHTEYGELELSLGIVASLDAAIDHIHAHGSSHTESILTEDPIAAERFLREVDAAGVFHNASTRFADGFRYGFGAEVGISTSKFHARGPVGLEGLTTYKYVLRGAGHTAGDYRGATARKFTHRRPAE